MPTPFLFYKAIIYKDAVHRPLGTNERLSVDSIPVSQQAGNKIRLTTDGLYVGDATSKPTYYVAAAGNDVPTAGDKGTPFKTLVYALDQIINDYNLNYPGGSPGSVEGNITIALKAGETFILNKRYDVFGNLTLTFYGDPQYGDFNGPLIGTPGTVPAVMADLLRPIITPLIDPATSNGVYHFQAAGLPGELPTVQLYGVRVDLPFGSVQNSDYCSFFNVSYERSGCLKLLGAVINKLDALSSYGLFGCHSRAVNAVLQEFSSQLWINGKPVQQLPSQPAPTADELTARKWFIIFYPDFHGNNQSGGQLLDGPVGTGIVQLQWTVSTAEVVTGTGGKTNLATFPVVADATFGISNYFFNLVRDNQGRPLNCITPALF